MKNVCGSAYLGAVSHMAHASDLEFEIRMFFWLVGARMGYAGGRTNWK